MQQILKSRCSSVVCPVNVEGDPEREGGWRGQPGPSLWQWLLELRETHQAFPLVLRILILGINIFYTSNMFSYTVWNYWLKLWLELLKLCHLIVSLWIFKCYESPLLKLHICVMDVLGFFLLETLTDSESPNIYQAPLGPRCCARYLTFMILLSNHIMGVV